MPEIEWDMSQHPLFIASRTFLQNTFGSELSKKTLIDLGCLEGGFTAEFARLGMQAAGLEVRSSNFQNCEFVRKALKLPNLHFIQDDCWNVAKYGRFDVVFCSGLLYHLHDPAKYLGLLSTLCDALILDTHYAYDEQSKAHSLSEKTSHEGYEGRWYREYEEGTNTKDDKALWTSWGNDKSFWPMKDELLRMVSDAGFDILDKSAFERHEIERFTIIAVNKLASLPR